MSTCVTVDCWELRVWRGHWQVRTRFDAPEPARLALLVNRRRDPFGRYRLVRSTRLVATYVEATAPTEAQRFRERQADTMAVLRQSMTYYKSGSNGTEIASIPPEAKQVQR